MRRWMKGKMENSDCNNEEPKANDRKRRRRKSLPDNELKLLNDLSGFPHLATIFREHVFIRARKALKRKKMSGHVTNSWEIGTQPQAIGALIAEEQEESKGLESIAHMPGRKTEITENDNGNVEEQRSGKKEKKRKCLPDDELKILNDLSGFPHLATMFQAGQVLRERKESWTEKMDSPETNSAENGCQSQITVDASREDCVEDTYELLQMHKDNITVEVIDCPSSSPGNAAATDFRSSGNIGEMISPSSGDLVIEEQQEKSSPDERDGTTEDVLVPLAEDVLPVKLLVDAGVGDAYREVSKSLSIESKSATTEDNIVLRKLLRRRRYFDSRDENFHLEGHAVKSVAKSRRKRCYVCGDVQHTGDKCRKRRTCYSCNERGHLAEDCPKSSQEFNICLRCGESGHDLFSCNNDYPPDDLKNILCYVCNEGGHICCCSYTNISSDITSCYNCGESGHSGSQCPKPHMDKKSSLPPLICYKCGEGGHAARKCGIPMKKKHQQSKECSAKSING